MDDWRLRDDSSLKAGRTYSVQSELYHQWAVYRLEALAKRAAAMQVSHPHAAPGAPVCVQRCCHSVGICRSMI